MKPWYLLTVTLSLTSAFIPRESGPGPHGNKLQKRVWGNRPGSRGYDYEDDPDWRGNRGGTLSSGQLRAEDRAAKERARDPPSGFRPRLPDPPLQRRSTSDDYHSRSYPRPPKRDDQVKKTRAFAYTDTSKYPNGDERFISIGAQIPFPAQGSHPYGRVIGTGQIGADILSPSGRVGVTTSQVVGQKFGLGPVFLETKYTTNQDLNPAPRPRPRPQPVQAEPGRKDSYYMRTSDAERRPVYLSRDGNLYSERSGRRIHGNPAVYLNNGPGRKLRRDDAIDGLSQATEAPGNSTDSLQSEWQTYYEIYVGLRANATALLTPVLNGLVNASNTSYAYEMAWSIHSHLTGSPNEYSDGPYMNGLANFDNFQDNWLLDNGFLLDDDSTIYRPANGTVSNSTLLQAAQMLAVTDHLQTTYYDTWDAAVAAVNVTNPSTSHTILEDLVYYANVVTATNSTDILPESFRNVDLSSAQSEASWFLQGINNFY